MATLSEQYIVTLKDAAKKLTSSKRRAFEAQVTIDYFDSKLRIPVKAATQTAGMRPPNPFKEATLSERSDAGSLFLLYLISCRQICLLFS
jgi:hypothetical protein